MRQEKHLSQFSPAVGKRLRFPWSRSLLIPVLSLFLSCCFTFALAARLHCPTSPPPTSALVSLHVPLQAWWDGYCSPGQMIDASPRHWRWGLQSRCYNQCLQPLLLLGRRGHIHQGSQSGLQLLFNFT